MRRMGRFDEQKTIGELTDINLKDKVDGVIECTKEAASTLLGDIPSEDIDFTEENADVCFQNIQLWVNHPEEFSLCLHEVIGQEITFLEKFSIMLEKKIDTTELYYDIWKEIEHYTGAMYLACQPVMGNSKPAAVLVNSSYVLRYAGKLYGTGIFSR